MDKYDLMCVVTEIFEELESETAITNRKEEAIRLINSSANIAIACLKTGLK